jgi:hypothetical protein
VLDPTDTARGEILVTWSGEQLRLRPTLEALEEIEAKTGQTVLMLCDQTARMAIPFRQLVTVVACGLRAAGQQVTTEQVKRQVWQDGLAAWMEPVARLLAGCLHGGKTAEELVTANPPKASQA